MLILKDHIWKDTCKSELVSWVITQVFEPTHQLWWWWFLYLKLIDWLDQTLIHKLIPHTVASTIEVLIVMFHWTKEITRSLKELTIRLDIGTCTHCVLILQLAHDHTWQQRVDLFEDFLGFYILRIEHLIRLVLYNSVDSFRDLLR